jgi:osmotically-inducible protein OsmY
MKSNADLQKDVQDAIKWEPLLHAAEIGVTSNDGIITLTGTVVSFTKKKEAEDAAKKVAGVKAVVEEITVTFSIHSLKKNDDEIAVEVVTALNRNLRIPDGKVKVEVEKGWITLGGELQWNYQRESVIDSIKNLSGVMGIVNNITIKSEGNDLVEQRDIEHALERNWSVDAQNISVKVLNHKVTLMGNVASWYQKEEAAHIAWKAPGVWYLDNELLVNLNVNK